MFRLTELFVDITARDQQVKSTVDGLQGKLGAMGIAIGTAAGNLVSQVISSATASLAGFFSSGIKGAIDLQETMSKINTIFGDSSAIISKQADEMASKFGVVKGEFLNAASDFGSAFKAIGAAAPEAAALGNQLAKLGMDMASFNNASNEEAFTALRAALRGEFDPLERFNVMLSAAAIEQEALSLGLIKSAKDMDENAKKQATLSLIMKKTIDQQGDMERTADGSANSWRKFMGTITNLATEMGGTLEPAINSIISVGNEMLTGLVSSFQASKASFESFAAGVSEGAQTVGIMWRNLADIWQIVQLKAIEMAQNVVNAMATIPENLAIIATYIGGNWVKINLDAANAVGRIFLNLGRDIYALGQAIAEFLSDPMKGFHVDFKPLLEGFKATADALPELIKPRLVSMQNEIDKVTARISDREAAARQDGKSADAAQAAKAIATATAKKQKEFKSETMGSADFATQLRMAIFDKSGKDDIPNEQLKTQQRIAAAVEQTAAAMAKGLVARAG
jgi:hypothetical protein